MTKGASGITGVLGLPAALLVGAGMLALAGVGPALAVGDGDGIEGSPHDFSAEVWNFRGEICRVCHVPHDHNRNEALWALGLLWNHQVSSASYTMYDATHSPTLDGLQSDQPDGISKLCLGCHDGTVALGAFDKESGEPRTVAPSNTTKIGDVEPDAQWPGPDIPLDNGNLDLRGTHPLSIAYDEMSDPGLRPQTSPMGSSGMTIADVLDGGKVQCSSCHDVHDSTGEAVPQTHLLRVGQKSSQGGASPSQLCLTCHIK